MPQRRPSSKSLDSAGRRDLKVHGRSSPALKVALFRSLFRGREDVYARRFESRKSGRSGYQPDCANEWVRGVCEKPKIKCTDCPHQRFRPVTNEAVTWHLQGHDDAGAPFVAGVYPMFQENLFLFRGGFRQEQLGRGCGRVSGDVSFTEYSCRIGTITLRRWRAHLDILRQGGPRLAGEASWRLHYNGDDGAAARVGLRSYDRFFPNQDTLPKGGFGNLIALPLQKRPRDRGNSIF